MRAPQAAIANDVAAAESSLDHAPSNLPQFDRFIGTIWHQPSSVVLASDTSNDALRHEPAEHY
jgi:hypothetical protein